MSDEKQYAILRFEKLHTVSEISGSVSHMIRSIPTPNADAARTKFNRILKGSKDPQEALLAAIPGIDSRNEDGKLLRRKNSVLVIEFFAGASPDWWKTSTPDMRQNWLNETTAFFINEFGADNLIDMQLHVDEGTPHVTGHAVPLDPASGALNARRWLGGAQKLSALQTRYASRVEHLGLSRGIKGSTAKHERVKRHYAQIDKPVIDPEDLGIETPPRLMRDPEAWAKEQAERVARAMEPALANARTAESDRSNRKRAEAQSKKDRKHAERLEKSLDEQKALAARMRALPLPDVLDALGFSQDKREKNRWKAEGFNVTLGEGAKSGKWFDHIADHGRGGAIDLVQHVMQTDFKGALAWLSDRFGPGATAADLTARMRTQAVSEVKAAVKEREPFTPPSPSAENWPGVRKHLVDDRALPGSYIDKLHEQGNCYADARRNAVFLCRDEAGRVTGAELKGTVTRHDGSRFAGMAPGSRKGLGGFRIGNLAKATAVYLVESAIDAISLMRLRTAAPHKERDICVISTAGTTPEPRSWFDGLSKKVRRICAFDNDDAGDKAAHKLRRFRFERSKPVGKDWNADLVAMRDASRADNDTHRETPTTDADETPSPS
jgi:hypothetical protein